ncbi:MAG: alkaline phosphatase family protein [Steroidobacteraceae bacterium]
MNRIVEGPLRGLLLACLCWLPAGLAGAAHKTENVVLIVSDGLRWQEMFSGVDPGLLGEHGGNWMHEQEMRKRYWSEDPQERRHRLFPFVWDSFAKHGQIFGNQLRGSVAKVSNGKAFSYPGYNEMTTGFPNDAIDSNEYGPNPNKTVFEWLNESPGFKGRVAVFGTWDAYHRIFNIGRSHLPIQAGWDLPRATGVRPYDDLLRRLFQTTTHFDEEDLPNSLLQPPLLDYVRRNHPRVLFVGYGETDNWAHQGRYDAVLDAAKRTDGFVRELWQTMIPATQYRDKTTFIFTCDHGRGAADQWREHGVEERVRKHLDRRDGPRHEGAGASSGHGAVTQAQIAATIAALLERDFPKACREYPHHRRAVAGPLSPARRAPSAGGTASLRARRARCGASRRFLYYHRDITNLGPGPGTTSPCAASGR